MVTIGMKTIHGSKNKPVMLGTNYVLKDEKAFSLSEVNEQSPNNKGLHRYQRIVVIRDDKPALYRKDLGEAIKFKGVDQMIIPSYMAHTVAELQWMATQYRFTELFDKRELAHVDKYKN